jgi:hypothetical protein
MVGYEKYNSLKKQWEYYSTKKRQTSNSYGEPISTFDADLAIKVLQAKQNQYDRLSNAEKARIRASREYNRKKSYVNRMVNKPVKKALKKTKKLERELKRNYKKTKGKEKIDITTLKNGWYNCYANIGENVYSRKVLIEDGDIIQYLNGRNILLQIISFEKEYSNIYEIYGSVLSTKVQTNIFIIDDKIVKNPDIAIPTRLIIYTTSSDINGDIGVILKGDEYYIGGPYISHYLENSPNCNQTKYVINILAPAGKYKYYAFSDTEFWTDEIMLNEYDCRKINLTN